MHYQRIGNEVQLLYDDAYAPLYRESDEVEVATDNHRQICETLAGITRSFGREISVLDLGCGTGRYFHCIERVNWLVAVDISLPVLLQARRPVKSEQIKVKKVDLICANIFELELAPDSFDFIYSIGVLGEFSPFDARVCGKMLDLLKPGGKVLFTVVDVTSKYQFMSWKRRVAETVSSFLPSSLQRPLRERLKTYFMNRSQLERLMRRSGFMRHEINLRVSTAAHWIGAHYECLATKAKADPATPKLR
ncbi:MAG TPA: class I SAM-dependent methyltransferase [Candidatus Binatia bacterium]|nr:class I SAM-dependent methyltransferase [Candidatus Binatia bacterium]